MRRALRTALLLAVVILTAGSGVTLLSHLRDSMFGDAPFVGSNAEANLHSATVDMLPTPDGNGYSLISSDGGVFTFGNAQFYGSMGDTPLQGPVVDATSTPTGNGYWLVASDGGVFSFGDAEYFGRATQLVGSPPATGIAATPTGTGYWVLLADGGVVTFGDAPFLGSAAGDIGTARAVSIAAMPWGLGYWIATSDGGVFSFGDAGFHGSRAGLPMNAPMVKMAPTVDGSGYWLAGADGGVFCYDAPMYGSAGSARSNPVLAIAASPQGDGYWLAAGDGRVSAFDTSGQHGDEIKDPPPPVFPVATGGDAPPGVALGGRVGPSNPNNLTPVAGFTVADDGAVIENVNVWGEIRVTANNVTIRNFRANNVIKDGGAGLTLQDGEIHGIFNGGADGVAWSDYTAERLDVHNVFDGFKAHGNVVIRDSWIHDLNFFTGDDAGAGGYSHNDAIQVSSGSNIVIQGNRIERNQGNAGVFIDADQGPIDNVTVTGNVIGGGGFSLYSIRSRSAPHFGSPTNVFVVGNVFTEEHLFDYATIAPGTGFLYNVNEGGAAVLPRIDDLS